MTDDGGSEGPRDALTNRETARRAVRCGAEGPRDALTNVHGAEGPRDALFAAVQRDRASR